MDIAQIGRYLVTALGRPQKRRDWWPCEQPPLVAQQRHGVEQRADNRLLRPSWYASPDEKKQCTP